MTAAGGRALVSAIREALAGSGDPERAERQQAYLRSTMPHRGLTAPELRTLLRPILAAHRLKDPRTWEDTARELWDGATHREEWYAALGLLRHRYYRGWAGPGSLELYQHLVRSGAWWDVVDEIAAHLVGAVLAEHRASVTPVVASWATDDHLWVRRTSILAQLGHRGATDTRLLRDVLTANLEGSRHGSEFFIRKAAGWALRDYARTNPAWVLDFVDIHADRLSGLTRREALRHLQ